MISKYFDKIKNEIGRYAPIIKNYKFTENVYSEERGFINGQLSFIDQSRLDFTEVKDTERPEKVKYQYHYMDSFNNMIFRYDNAKHHKEISTFPHHKHLPDKIIESSEPEISDVLEEILVFIKQKSYTKVQIYVVPKIFKNKGNIVLPITFPLPKGRKRGNFRRK